MQKIFALFGRCDKTMAAAEADRFGWECGPPKLDRVPKDDRDRRRQPTEVGRFCFWRHYAITNLEVARSSVRPSHGQAEWKREKNLSESWKEKEYIDQSRVVVVPIRARGIFARSETMQLK